MTDATLAIAEPLWMELASWLEEGDEIAGVLTAQVLDDARGTTLLARRLELAPDASYLERRHDGLVLRSNGWVPAVRRAACDGEMAIFVHTHPSGTARFSSRDDRVDDDLWQDFIRLTGASLYGALLLAGSSRGPQLAGRLRRRDGSTQLLTKVRVVGERLVVHELGEANVVQEVHDRQVRALGSQGQQALQGLRAGVVGVGGTGSPIAEQLIRLGVGTVVAIDDDEVTASTVSRGYGSTTADVGRTKVDVLAKHAQRIGLGTTVDPVQGNLRDREIVEWLRHCDVVFSCVDGHSARLILNRWAYWHLAPVIDVAVLVSSNHGTIESIDGRLTWLAPGAACLLCRGRVDPTAAYAEHLDPAERRRLAEQGYAPELDEPQPSIVSYTTLMAALAVTELLNRMFGLANTLPTEVLLQLRDRSISLNRRKPRDGCFCGAPEEWAKGHAEPYLDLTWTR